MEKYTISATEPLSSGEHQVRMEFSYDGGGLGKGGSVTLYIDGHTVGSAGSNIHIAMVFSADETSDVGLKRGAPITPDLPTHNNAFTGTVQVIVIETDTKENIDHLISREDLVNMLMTLQ